MSFGSGVCVGTSALRRAPRPSMSTTRMSTLPSRSTSEKSTAIEELLVFRTARRGTARNVPVPSFSQNRSGSSKSRSEEHTSELQSRLHLVCRLLLEKKKKKHKYSNKTFSNTTQAHQS